MRPLEFGWYLPTHGDTTAYGLAEAQIAGSPELCERVVNAAEEAGFEYLLIPVGSTIIYAHMQAVGMVNDHLESCFRYSEVEQLS